MKKIYISLIFIVTLVMGLGSCSGDYDSFVGIDEYQTKPSMISNVSTEALPGEIKLKWNVPTDSNYYLLQIRYYDHLTKSDKAQVLTVYGDSVIIPDTREKYGDYEFSFQTFNAKKEGSEIIKITAKSGKAPITETLTPTKLKLTVGQLSTNAAEPTEGPIANLLDNNPNTFFHTKWSGGGQPWPHWLEVKLDEPIQNFQFYYQNRNGSVATPTDADVMISNDGITWELLENLTSGMPAGNSQEYTSKVYRATAPFSYFRFSVNAATRNGSAQSSFNMAEFAMYNVHIDVYDPEAPDNN